MGNTINTEMVIMDKVEILITSFKMITEIMEEHKMAVEDMIIIK